MKKLYVLVRADLTPEQKAVQAGHAVAEYLIKNPTTEWDNGTLVYLSVKNEFELGKWAFKMEDYSVKYARFIEPDIGDQTTAIAAISDGLIFKNLPLLRL